ncbi:ABC transporter ATP-binding protein [Bacillaceae bacterium JMAK1]|nr:ABC transporter ATP-binding protein [Bacillaceae bacterium JMAK1]
MAFLQIRQLCKYYNQQSTKAVNEFTLDIEEGEIISLLGPSGCGKTTTLRMIAGFEQPSAGSMIKNDQVIYDENTNVAPEKRSVGMVFQDFALFPHLTIEKNITFGLTKMSRQARKDRALEMLQLIGLENYAKSFPHELSGGQQQRIALARALAPKPDIVLLDEPFSNLDSSMKDQMRKDVAYMLREQKTTAIFVTHDQKDAFAISDRVIVMNQGAIQQVDHPKVMYKRPCNQFVASFVGKTNLINGIMTDDESGVMTSFGNVQLLHSSNTSPKQEVKLSIRPESCQINQQGQYSGIVSEVYYAGEYQEVRVCLNCTPEACLQGEKEEMLIRVSIEHDIELNQPISFDIMPDLIAVVNE